MKHKILVDLKPAFDGYAGIPQESRLLFACLNELDNIEIEGLLQHGNLYLKPGLKPNIKLTPAKKINKLSRIVISSTPTIQSYFEKIFEKLKNKLKIYPLRLKAIFNIKLSLGTFEPNYFHDFIWRTFFSKTLGHNYKGTVTQSNYRVLQPSRQALHFTGLANRYLGLAPIYPKLNTSGVRFLLAQTPFPARVSQGTTLIVRYHDAVPVLMPHTISDNKFHQTSHFYALQDNVRSGAWFACISEATRRDLLTLFPEIEPRTTVIYNIVSEEFFETDSTKERVLQIISDRLGKIEFKKKDKENNQSIPVNLKALAFENIHSFQYIVAVGTIEPRKNYPFLLDVFEELKATNHPQLKLVIVGSLGWGYAPIIEKFTPLAARGDLFFLSDVPTNELRILYQHAAATLCPSVGEGFGYPGIEAMRCGGLVIASDIPVHREIYGDASVYFDPYNIQQATHIIDQTLTTKNDGEQLCNLLRNKGRCVSGNFLKENVLIQWQTFFEKIAKTTK